MCDASILKGLLIFMSLAYELRIPVVVVVVVGAARPKLRSLPASSDAGFRCRTCLFL